MEAGQDGATDILDLKDYITKANEQLQDNSFYQKLNVDPTAKHSEIVNSAIENLKRGRPIIKLDSQEMYLR